MAEDKDPLTADIKRRLNKVSDKKYFKKHSDRWLFWLALIILLSVVLGILVSLVTSLGKL
ncbi:hypothetical protein [Lactobacillus corticis]|uniref:DUF4044 domain-containing protein n=1 Tax=Lactobacillus corticis TaxID=2201249 RepID=A0A916QJA4_9LACO|nr:hypothetical protein [Lactobacillus corticis]GFZ26613.1 hypothetical protein LCB40_04930 [Lactobacillus corticis]